MLSLNRVNMASMLSLLVVSCLLCGVTHSYPEQGQWVATMDTNHSILSFMKSMYKGSQISVSITCEGTSSSYFSLEYLVRRSPCAQEYIDVTETYARIMIANPDQNQMNPSLYSSTEYIKNRVPKVECGSNKHFYIPYDNFTKPTIVTYTTEKPTTETKDSKKATASPIKGKNSDNSPSATDSSRKKRDAETADENKSPPEAGASLTTSPVPVATTKRPIPPPTTASTTTTKSPPSHDKIDHQPMVKVWEDGYYLLVLAFSPAEPVPKGLSLEVTVRMMQDDSYIAAVEKPLLIFFGVMGLVYIGYGIAWLFMLACNWRDLLRIQFWIGGVILLGMLEKAVFFAEYENLNNTGQSVRGAIILAELVSCLKRSLARMLVIIVSLGFGIVKPRLGQTLHKVLLVGLVYMILASIEGCTRALSSKADQSRSNMLAAVPLAVTDAIICWWIFSSLLQTTRTLRLRRNVVKLSLFRHFTNTLIFAVLASVAYMIWFLTQHRFKQCLTDWKELWVDDAFWHLLFSVILLIIMILWRPNANNQRYAFSPLLDAADDDMDDDQVLSEAYEGMKMRTTQTQQRNGPSRSADGEKKLEDDLKWVEENIPSSLADKVLPALDSDEEIMNTRFEVSKME